MITNVSWERLRKMIAARDNGRCVYCNTLCSDGSLDHVLPLSKGGTDSIDNLVWSCRSCNSSKGDKTLREWVVQKRTETKNAQKKPLSQKITDLPLYRAQGFECDCGGYGYMTGLARWCIGIWHGHHRPECPILQYLKQSNVIGWYSPIDSKIVNGKVHLGQTVCRQDGTTRFWAASLETKEAFYEWLETGYGLRYKIFSADREKRLLAEIEHNKKYPYKNCFLVGGLVRKSIFTKWQHLIVLFCYGDGSVDNYQEYATKHGFKYFGWIHDNVEIPTEKKEKMFLLNAVFDIASQKMRRKG